MTHACLRIAFCTSVLWLGAGATAAPATVTVENKTRPTACAEEDNVSLALSGRGIARFRVEALQPPFLAGIGADTTAPDFSNCNFDQRMHAVA